MLTLSGTQSLPELALRPAQATTGTAAAASVPGEDFGALIGRLAGETAAAVRSGEAAALAGVQGGLPLQTVVERVMAAERTLQAAIAVRDKAVSAYQEISRMQI